jgi:glycosyltransferase involved in cell wall biosynthesis
MAVTPAISVVIPTYRRPALLRRCLQSLADQDLAADEFEVVVVDDGSGDQTTDVLATATPNVRGLAQPRNAGPAAARNRGFDAARGDIVLFLDDDIAAAPDLLATHLRLHGESNDDRLGILGRVDWDPSLEVTPFMHWLDRSGLQFGYDTWLKEGPVEPPYAAFYTCNVSLPRALLVASGGFDERFPYAAYEDMELAFRLTAQGFHLDYRPAAQAFHTRAMELRGFCARMDRVGESAELMRRAAPEFPLDDSHIRRRVTDRRTRWKHRLAASLRATDRTRGRYYWAEVAAAYERGRKRVRTPGARK